MIIIRVMSMLITSMFVLGFCNDLIASEESEIVITDKRSKSTQSLDVELGELCKASSNKYQLERLIGKDTFYSKNWFFRFRNNSNSKVFIHLTSGTKGYWINTPFINYYYQTKGDEAWKKVLYGPIDVDRPNLEKVGVLEQSEITFRALVPDEFNGHDVAEFSAMLIIYKNADEIYSSECALSKPFR